MDGWMICDFTSCTAVFQPYQNDGRVIMKGYIQERPIYGWIDLLLRRDPNPGLR